MDRPEELPAADDRHLACTLTTVMLRLLAEEHGTASVDEVLRRAGCTRPTTFLTTDGNWISYDEAVALLEAAMFVTGDPTFSRKIGETVLRQHAGTAVATLLRSLGSPEAVLGASMMAASKLSTITEIEALENEPGHAVVRAVGKAGFSRHPQLCQYTAGVLSQATVLFGLPPAGVVEETCQAHGDAECRFVVTWDAEAAAKGADPQERVTALEAQLLAMQQRLRDVFATVGDLLSVEELDVVLARIVERAAQTVRAPRYVLAVHTRPDADLRIFSDGVGEDEAQAIADCALADRDIAGWSALAADVVSNRCSYGRLVALYPEGAGFFPQEQELLALYAKHAAAVLDMATALEESARRHEHVSALLELAQALARGGTSQEVSESLAETVPAVIDCDRVSVWLWDPATASLRFATGAPTHGHDGALHDRAVTPDESPAVAQMRDHPHPVFFDDDTLDPFIGPILGALGLLRLVGVPIVARDELLGVLTAAVVDRPERLRRDPGLLSRLTGIAALAAPAIQNGRLVDELRHQAAHDPLTGLANRAGFSRRMADALASGDSGLGLLFVDLDGFKQVNDAYGHEAGDELLRAAAGRLGRVIREGDSVARLGGDEFAIILAGVSSEEEVVAVARRVREVLARPFAVAGSIVSISGSVGEARFPADGRDVDALVRHADAAMYREKSGARAA